MLSLSALCAAPALAQEQVPDTTAAWRYYPLEVGNIWEYHHHDVGIPARFERRAVERDTSIGPRRYFEQATYYSDDGATWTLQERVLLRFDTTAGRVVEHRPEGEHPRYCELGFYGPSACEEGMFEGGHFPGHAYFAGTSVRIGSSHYGVAAVKAFRPECGVCDPPWHPVFAARIGFVGRWMEFCGLCGTDIRYARVGGRPYGWPIVASEVGPPPNPALVVVAAPNPAVGQPRLLLVTSNPAVGRVEITDVLGRRLAVLHDGPIAAGTTVLTGPALPSGVYMVRAIAGVERSTARLIFR